ncbi:MAG TPA: molybdopterin dinucleotide binding domain-containing protein, partial [Phytomonospora sp.]
DELLSEVAIICRLGETLLDQGIPWSAFAEDYRIVRERIARIVPGFADYEEKVADSIGFVLPHPPRDSRTFTTPTGRAVFTVSALTAIEVPEGRLLLQTLRSHDQYNTTIYGLDDRYRGIHNGRRVVLVNPDDLAELGLADGDMVDIYSEWPGDADRHVHDFRIVSYPTARGCAAAYFPEANPLVPLDHTAKGSHTPVSKALIVRLVARSGG